MKKTAKKAVKKTTKKVAKKTVTAKTVKLAPPSKFYVVYSSTWDISNKKSLGIQEIINVSTEKVKAFTAKKIEKMPAHFLTKKEAVSARNKAWEMLK